MEFWASILTLTFGTIRTAEFSASRGGRTFTPKGIPWYSFLLEAEWTPRATEMRTGVTGRLKISKDPTGNRAWNFRSCGIVSQPTAPLTPMYEGHLESKERVAIQRYLLIIGKKKYMQVL